MKVGAAMPAEDESIIESKSDWEWYMTRLDVERKYKHRHNGQPEQYPCKVHSSWHDDDNGPYTYEHTFFYKKQKRCEHCGHVEIGW